MQAIVVTLDHLALGFLGCYGSAATKTAGFDQLAANSVVFDQCLSAASAIEAVPGLMDLAAGLRERGGVAIVHECDPSKSAGSALSEPVSEFLRAGAAGACALLWLKCPAVASPWGASASRVREVLRTTSGARELRSQLSAALPELVADAHAGTESTEEWIAALPAVLKDSKALDRDQFAESVAVGRLRRILYAAAVVEVDAWLAELMVLLDDDATRDVLLIVTAGSGDLAGADPELAAGRPPLIAPLCRVWLLVRTRTSADGTRRGGLVSTADIAPTLGEWLQRVPQDCGPQSRSLWPLLRDHTANVRDERLIGSPETGWRLEDAGFACVCSRAGLWAEAGDVPESSGDRPRLFVKPDDAWDTLDVAREHPEVTERMVSRIRELAGQKAETA